MNAAGVLLTLIALVSPPPVPAHGTVSRHVVVAPGGPSLYRLDGRFGICLLARCSTDVVICLAGLERCSDRARPVPAEMSSPSGPVIIGLGHASPAAIGTPATPKRSAPPTVRQPGAARGGTGGD